MRPRLAFSIFAENMQQNTKHNKASDSTGLTPEQVFESKLLKAICKKLIELEEIAEEADFLGSYPKENLADIHNEKTGAYYLMTGEKPLKLVEYNIETLEVSS